MEAQEEQSSHLPVHEWMAVVALLLLMGGLAAVVLIERDRSAVAISHTPHYTVAQEIEIVIEGAVEKPGSYRIPRGTHLKELLEMAVPTADANLKRLKLDRVLRKGQVVKVPRNKPKKSSKPKQRKKKANRNV